MPDTSRTAPSKRAPRAFKDRQLATLRRIYERRQIGMLWGRRHWITPRVVDGKIGNGGKLFWLSAIMTRPNYYILRVPSDWLPTELPEDAVDRMEEAIEESFGNADWTREENDDADLEPFPAYHDGGCAWGEITWDEVMHAALKAGGRHGR